MAEVKEECRFFDKRAGNCRALKELYCKNEKCAFFKAKAEEQKNEETK